MTSLQTIRFEPVRNGDSELIVRGAGQLVLLDGCPDPAIPPHSKLCFLGHHVAFFLFNSNTIRILDLKSNIVYEVQCPMLDVDAVTSLEDRWHIIVGRSQVAILDVLTRDIDTFKFHAMDVDKAYSCAARRNQNFAEVFVSSKNGNNFHIYKAQFPIKCRTEQLFAMVEKENATLKQEISDVKAENDAMKKNMTSLQDKMAHLENLLSNMLMVTTKK